MRVLIFILTVGYFLANFERLVLGYIKAEFCKQILNTRVKALDDIYKIHTLLHLRHLWNPIEKRASGKRPPNEAHGPGEEFIRPQHCS